MIEEEKISFTSGIRTEDNLANYWLMQVTLRLRREICWLQNEQRINIESINPVLPEFPDKLSSILNIEKFYERKIDFFENDVTAKYLSNKLDFPESETAPTLIPGSFSWVVKNLNLDYFSCFVLMLGAAPLIDNTIGSIISYCLLDQNKIKPNISLVQKLWDNKNEIIKLNDPSHPLFRFGLIQFQNNYNFENNFETPYFVPPTVLNQLLFPDSPLPSSLQIITYSENEIIQAEFDDIIAEKDIIGQCK